VQDILFPPEMSKEEGVKIRCIFGGEKVVFLWVYSVTAKTDSAIDSRVFNSRKIPTPKYFVFLRVELKNPTGLTRNFSGG